MGCEELSVQFDCDAGMAPKSEQIGAGTKERKNHQAAQLEFCGSQEKRRYGVVELHAGMSCNNMESSMEGAQLLLRNREKWDLVRKACPTILSARIESGKGSLVATFTFRDGSEAVEGLVGFWRLRLKRVHCLVPKVVANGGWIPRHERDEKLKAVFTEYMLELLNGRLLGDHFEEAKKMLCKITLVKGGLKRKQSKLKDYRSRQENLTDMVFQHDQILRKIAEFEGTIEFIFLAIRGSIQDEKCGAQNFLLGPDLDWCRLHCLLERECERLQAQLPLYGRRSDIISKIHASQVTVLIGETGSGKSTQLVQYLADAGYATGGKSIVCTLPRKITANKLAERVGQESSGCIATRFPVGCVTTFSSSQSESLWAGITFTTEFVLLQLCLTDPFLSRVSCVVVDEVHERSLNTDLLLGLLKSFLTKRPDLKLIIMSATANADLLSSYFGAGEALHIPGRNFSVRIHHEPDMVQQADAQQRQNSEEHDTTYSRRVIEKVQAIHAETEEGTILAFLTSPGEVDWACRRDFDSSAFVLPFYAKLPSEDLRRVFEEPPAGMRKIVFATNIAETSLTIPDVKFVVDGGVAKDSVFDPRAGMTFLKVRKIDQSAAVQRAGRAGRTCAGVCYRLYSEHEFQEMDPHRLPEIKRIHLGLGILKLIALGVKSPIKFDFVEAPDSESILLALQDLQQLEAVKDSCGEYYVTSLGLKLVTLGVEPRLGKLLLNCIEQGYGQDGLVITAMMSNGRNIFYRSGTDEMKGRSDCLKMRFCHPDGDLFTFLSVYQEWDALPERARNRWCLSNSISAKALCRCREQVQDMKACLERELGMDVSPASWGWSQSSPSAAEGSLRLRKIIFSAMACNLAVFSGHANVGYYVVSQKQNTAYLHPSSAVRVFGAIPRFVVFGEMVHTSRTYLVSLTPVEPDWILSLCPSVKHDVEVVLEECTLHRWVVRMGSSNFLYRVRGKEGKNLINLESEIQKLKNQRCIIEQNHDDNTLVLFTTSGQMEAAKALLDELVARERRYMANESFERLVVETSYHQLPSPSLILCVGGLITDVLMPGEFAAVEVKYESCSRLDEAGDRELVELFDQCGKGISAYNKFPVESSAREESLRKGGVLQNFKWGFFRYPSRAAAKIAVELLNGTIVKGAILSVTGVVRFRSNHYTSSFPALKATLAWARRRRKGVAFVTCLEKDIAHILQLCRDEKICGPRTFVSLDDGRPSCVKVQGLDVDIDEKVLATALQILSGCQVVDVFMPRELPPLRQPSVSEIHQKLNEEISRYVPADKFSVVVYPPTAKDHEARAAVRFDESVHKEGFQALAHLEGLLLPGFQWWQSLRHRRVVSAEVRCSSMVLDVVKDDMADLIKALQQQHPCSKVSVLPQENRFTRVTIKGSSLAVTAGCKSAIEKLLEGQLVSADVGIETSHMKLLFTRRGTQLIKSVESQTGTIVMYDRRTWTAKIYGSKDSKAAAMNHLRRGLAELEISINRRQIALRGDGIPPGLMREIVKVHGPELQGLRKLAGDSMTITVDHQAHLLLVEGGSTKDLAEVQNAVESVAGSLVALSSGNPSTPPMWPQAACDRTTTSTNDAECAECAICSCAREDEFCLEGCGHLFCRSCLIHQVNSSIHHREGFPLSCAQSGCNVVFSLTDIRTLLTSQQQAELQAASLSAFVAQSAGRYRFCTTPDCPNVYRVYTRATGYSNSDSVTTFACAACHVHTCTACHVEDHAGLSCEEYQEFKVDPDVSLLAWRRGKQDVKNCPSCSSVIEKVDGCNHMTCKCGRHVCWICLEAFDTAEPCYNHLRENHDGF